MAILFIGFSIIDSVVLILSIRRLHPSEGRLYSKSSQGVLFSSLAGLQLAHYLYLTGADGFLFSAAYRMLLYVVAPAFYFCSRSILFPKAQARWFDLAHGLPVITAQFLVFKIAFPLAFLVGSGYLLWLLKRVYGLRSQRVRFKLELFGLFILLALAILVLGLVLAFPLIPMDRFFSLYSIAIGIGFLVVQWLLVTSPGLVGQVTEAVQVAYGESTLSGVDTEAVMKQLSDLMEEEKIFTDEHLNLGALARRLNLNPHQLSEFINTRIGTGFSRYIREYRVEEAKRQLIKDSSASVLSIGLEVGFTSQSNFYTAFRDIVGIAPGEFRKKHS